jgi:uncharacterized protein (TIGR02145 family)
MKPNRLILKKACLLFTLATSLLQSCAKKNNENPNTVIINGTVYPTAVINGQTWTTQNYSGPGGNEVLATASYGIVNGNYYNAFNITLPAGWRIPNVADFNNLLQAYKGRTDQYDNYEVSPANTAALESINGWINITGTNTSGFNAVPAGILPNSGALADLVAKGSLAVFLSTTIYQNNSAFALAIASYPSVDNGFSYSANITTVIYSSNQCANYCSVRFVKDN